MESPPAPNQINLGMLGKRRLAQPRFEALSSKRKHRRTRVQTSKISRGENSTPPCVHLPPSSKRFLQFQYTHCTENKLSTNTQILRTGHRARHPGCGKHWRKSFPSKAALSAAGWLLHRAKRSWAAATVNSCSSTGCSLRTAKTRFHGKESSTAPNPINLGMLGATWLAQT